jgi:hypothetical membrane protein
LKFITLSVIYFAATIIVAHFFVPPEYRWTQNTISDLAAQGLKYQWIMQAGFIGFGVLLNMGIVQVFIREQKVNYPDLLIMIYGFAVLLTGFFSTAPFLKDVSYSVKESNIHSLFATLAGVAFSAGIMYRLIIAPTPGEKYLHVLFLVLVLGSSLLFGLCENGILLLGKGLVQRFLYLASFIWLLISR